MYPRDYRDYAEIESLPSHPARMPKCVSGKLSLNHRVFTRGRYHASDPKLYAFRIACYHQEALVVTARYAINALFIFAIYMYIFVHLLKVKRRSLNWK